MNEALLQAKIHVTGISQPKAGAYVIQDGVQKYSFFETKKDGSESAAFQSFKELDVKIGSEVGVKYAVTKKPNQYGKQVEYKNVRFFVDPQDIQFQDRNLSAQAKIEDKVDWDAKERLSAAQTSINAAATIFQGTGEDVEKVKVYATAFYNYLMAKKLGTKYGDFPVKDAVPQEDISAEDIGFLED